MDNPFTPRAYTREEALASFNTQFHGIVKYWAGQYGKAPPFPGAKPLTVEDVCDGVRFSIMNVIDGGSALPGLKLLLDPHPDDKQYAIDNSEMWFEPGLVLNEDVSLHDMKSPFDG